MTTKPDLSRIWADGGTVEDPDVTLPGKFDTGWIAEIPTFENMNFLQQLFSTGLLYLAENGISEWSNDIDFAANAIQKGSDGNVYRATAANGPATTIVDPVGDTTEVWVPALNTGRLIGTESATDVYTAELPTVADGFAFEIEFATVNTGACTLNGLDIHLMGGTVDPAAGDITPDQLTRVIYRSSPSAHFELDRTGKVVKTVVTATDAAWTPQPDTKTISFDEVLGGGGGGGGVDGQGGGTAGASGGGSSGARGAKTTSVIDASYNITIGAGGAGGSGNNNGVDGGDTTIVGSVGPGTNVNVTCPGGGGGTGLLANGAFLVGSGGALAVAPTGVDFGTRGGVGEDGISTTLYQVIPQGGSAIGSGSRGGNNGSANNAQNYGDGGGGCTISAATTNIDGGDGGDGVVVITEYL